MVYWDGKLGKSVSGLIDNLKTQDKQPTVEDMPTQPSRGALLSDLYDEHNVMNNDDSGSDSQASEDCLPIDKLLYQHLITQSPANNICDCHNTNLMFFTKFD